jgi:hypothetical protein
MVSSSLDVIKSGCQKNYNGGNYDKYRHKCNGEITQ